VRLLIGGGDAAQPSRGPMTMTVAAPCDRTVSATLIVDTGSERAAVVHGRRLGVAPGALPEDFWLFSVAWASWLEALARRS
jgi:hypothetical protein